MGNREEKAADCLTEDFAHEAKTNYKSSHFQAIVKRATIYIFRFFIYQSVKKKKYQAVKKIPRWLEHNAKMSL